MDNLKELLADCEKSLMLGYKAKSYETLNTISEAYSKLYETHQTESSKLNQLQERHEQLKTTNESMILKVIEGQKMNFNANTPNSHQPPKSGMESLLEGLKY